MPTDQVVMWTAFQHCRNAHIYAQRAKYRRSPQALAAMEYDPEEADWCLRLAAWHGQMFNTQVNLIPLDKRGDLNFEINQRED